ncbi:hypothetical protein CEP82_003995 [Mobiluncus mulieris]|nr:hypothetical protein CEP82_003995 [Mobiluncus mulieris]
MRVPLGALDRILWPSNITRPKTKQKENLDSETRNTESPAETPKKSDKFLRNIGKTAGNMTM